MEAPKKKTFTVYNKFQVDEFFALIKLGAGRGLTWSTPQGEFRARLAFDNVKSWHYVMDNGVTVPAAEMLSKLATAGVDFTASELLPSDCEYV